MTDNFDPNFIDSNPENVGVTSLQSDLTIAGAATDVAISLEEKCLQLFKSLRPGQDKMGAWRGGRLAVSAVPGAGKSTGMAKAAALAIANFGLNSRRQLIVVTFTRSAAASIKAKIRKELRALSLPESGFVVHTLHGLALNIAVRHPNLSGLDLENSTLITPNKSHRLIRICVEKWIAENPRHYQILLEGTQFDGEETERMRRQSVLRTEILPELANTVIHEAKSSGLLPKDLEKISVNFADGNYEILAVAAGLYKNYQTLLRSQNFIDYDEMILGAVRVLENPIAKAIEQRQVFAVFEDEAQDSTEVQTKLLEILASNVAKPDLPPNFIRVGDPNQAINSTFTPADPCYFRRFCEACEIEGNLATMDQAGRSTQIIIDAANFVVEWVNAAKLTGKEQPFCEQYILPVANYDPQSNNNPPPAVGGLEICQPLDIYDSIKLICEHLIQLFSDEKNRGSAAILVRENKQGRFVKEVLENPAKYNLKFDLVQYGIKIDNVAERERYSQVPSEILAFLQFLDRPHSPDYLKAALKVLSDRELIPKQDYNALAIQSEQFLYPGPLDPQQSEQVKKCRYLCCNLLQAKLELPIYQLISFLALALKYNPGELATADKLIDKIVKQTSGNHSMSAVLDALIEIVSSERFEPVEIPSDDEEERENSYVRSRQVTIITMHKAKGLDWDYVFLPFLQETTIPGSLRVLPQSQFLGDFTLAEVARAQIRASLHQEITLPDVGTAWESAADLKKSEEFRLFYVAITRAKRLLWMAAEKKSPFSWNNLENLQAQNPSPVFKALQQKFQDFVVS
ncbi:DNA helicase UvrD [Oscillatoriales cyanobacterium USR001]|nr:DNA helicase UvrD [Oscillatoriales cyanobacterium USR001]